jgi:hypothetical protein
VVIQTEEALKVLEALVVADLLVYIITELYTLLLAVVAAALTTAMTEFLAAVVRGAEQAAAAVAMVTQKMVAVEVSRLAVRVVAAI